MSDPILDEFHRDQGPRLYLAYWPNGDVSLVQANSHKELWLILDREGDPNLCRVTEFTGKLHIQLLRHWQSGRDDEPMELTDEEAEAHNAWIDQVTSVGDLPPTPVSVDLNPVFLSYAPYIEENLDFTQQVEAGRTLALPLGDHFSEVYGTDSD